MQKEKKQTKEEIMEVLVKEKTREGAVSKFIKLFPGNTINSMMIIGEQGNERIYKVYYEPTNKGVLGSFIGISQGARKTRDSTRKSFSDVRSEFGAWKKRVKD